MGYSLECQGGIVFLSSKRKKQGVDSGGADPKCFVKKVGFIWGKTLFVDSFRQQNYRLMESLSVDGSYAGG